MKKTLLLSTLILSAVFILAGCAKTPVIPPNNNTNDQLIGGQKDEHDCLTAAGYSWCPSQQKCMRMWEEYCPDYADQYRGDNKATRNTTNLGGFCGRSTKVECQTDADCKVGGCSGQICHGKSESITSTCEWKDCYDETKYNLSCGCVTGVCQWYK
ncbi:MAG: eight-cysteine-cluster domain-containing protein [Patescibacteria group bacterium]|jgi:eight-cysteine-cluster-containing protein